MKTKYLTALIFMLMAACTSTLHLQPADADLALAQQRVPGITMTDLKKGYRVYTINCSGCHRLHDTKEFNAEQWKDILPEMISRAKLTNEKEKEMLANFLVAKSK